MSTSNQVMMSIELFKSLSEAMAKAQASTRVTITNWVTNDTIIEDPMPPRTK